MVGCWAVFLLGCFFRWGKKRMGVGGATGGLVNVLISLMLMLNFATAMFTTPAANDVAVGGSSDISISNHAFGTCGVLNLAINSDKDGCTCAMPSRLGDFCRKLIRDSGGDASALSMHIRGCVSGLSGRTLFIFTTGTLTTTRATGVAPGAAAKTGNRTIFDNLSLNCCMVRSAAAPSRGSDIISTMVLSAGAGGLRVVLGTAAGRIGGIVIRNRASGGTASTRVNSRVGFGMAATIPSVANCSDCVCRVCSAVATNLAFGGSVGIAVNSIMTAGSASCAISASMRNGAFIVAFVRGSLGTGAANTTVIIACSTAMGGGTLAGTDRDGAACLRCSGVPNSTASAAMAPSRVICICSFSVIVSGCTANGGRAGLDNTMFGLCGCRNRAGGCCGLSASGMIG